MAQSSETATTWSVQHRVSRTAVYRCRMETPPFVVLTRIGGPPRPSVVFNRRVMSPDTLIGKSTFTRPLVVPVLPNELRRIVRRDDEPHAAVGRAEIQSGALPRIAGQICRDAAVRRRAADVARYIGQVDPAIDGLEGHLRLDAVHREAAVARDEREVGGARYPDLVAHRPVLSATTRLRTVGADLARVGADHDLPRELACVILRFALRLHHGEHLHLVLVPCVHRDAAVLPAVDVQRARRCASRRTSHSRSGCAGSWT